MSDLGDIIEGAYGPKPVEIDPHTYFWGKDAKEGSMMAHMCAIRNSWCLQVKEIVVDQKRMEYALEEIDCTRCKVSEGWAVMRFGMEMPKK